MVSYNKIRESIKNCPEGKLSIDLLKINKEVLKKLMSVTCMSTMSNFTIFIYQSNSHIFSSVGHCQIEFIKIMEVDFKSTGLKVIKRIWIKSNKAHMDQTLI